MKLKWFMHTWTIVRKVSLKTHANCLLTIFISVLQCLVRFGIKLHVGLPDMLFNTYGVKFHRTPLNMVCIKGLPPQQHQHFFRSLIGLIGTSNSKMNSENVASLETRLIEYLVVIY